MFREISICFLSFCFFYRIFSFNSKQYVRNTMKIALLYFSGTGNTKWLAESLYANLKTEETDISLFDLEKEFDLDHHDYDKFIVAHPVYGATVPRLVIEKVDELIPGNRKLIIIATYGFVNALGIYAEKSMLGRKIEAYYNVKMFNDISAPGFKAPVKPLKKRLKCKTYIEKKIASIARDIAVDKKRIEGVGPQLLIGIRIRKAVREGLHTYYQTLGVDLDRCTHCGLCVRECPTHSIEEKDGDYIFDATCTACTRCYNHCPEHAITIKGKYADPEIYTRYTGPWK